MSKIINKHIGKYTSWWQFKVKDKIHRWQTYHNIPMTIYWNHTIQGSDRSIPIALILNEDDIEGSIEKYNMYLLLR